MSRERFIAEGYRQLSDKDVYQQLIQVVFSNAIEEVKLVLSHHMKEWRNYRDMAIYTEPVESKPSRFCLI